MFLDTSGLLCLLSVREIHHQHAKELFTNSKASVSHTYVIAELIALATARGMPRKIVLEFITCLADVPEVELISVDKELHRQAMELLWNRLDKSYSLCDAVSFILMREKGISEALTTDHHFAQERFKNLLA